LWIDAADSGQESEARTDSRDERSPESKVQIPGQIPSVKGLNIPAILESVPLTEGCLSDKHGVSRVHIHSGNIYWRLSEFLGFEYHPLFASRGGTQYRTPEGAVLESGRLPNLTVDIACFGGYWHQIHNSTLPDP
jgi:hypothetical protein